MCTTMRALCFFLLFLCFSTNLEARDVFPATTVPESLAITYNYGPEGKYPGGNEENFAKLANAGFRLVRFLPDWHLIERTKGVYDFSYCDKLMAMLAKNNLRPIISLGLTNHLYNAHYRIRTQEQRIAFGNFIRVMAKRYKGQRVIWELWNEPNVPSFWQPVKGETLTRDTSLKEYLAMAKAVIPIIRANDPNALVVGPSAANYNTVWLYKAIKNENMLSLFDGLSVHPYQPGNIPEKVIKQDAQVKTWIPASDIDKPLLFTELGYSIGVGRNEVTAELQGAYLQRQYLLSLMLGARVNAFYSMTDTDTFEPCKSADHCYGFFTRYSNQENPSLKAITTLVNALKGFEFSKRILQPTDTTYVLEFASPEGAKRYAVWDTIGAAPVGVTLPDSQRVEATIQPIYVNECLDATICSKEKTE